MKPNFFPFVLPPVFFFLLLLSSSLPSSLSTDYHYPKNCLPERCGGLINVTFPFWIRDLQSDYCGYPPFELQCDNGVAKLSMMEEDYHVLNISYQSRTATVSMSSSLTALNNCLSLPYYNLSFSLTPFAVSSLNRELVFVYNCTAAVNGSTEIACLDKGSYVYLGGEYQVQESKGSISDHCFAAVIPVLNSPAAEINNYSKLLADGFLLNWSAPDCSECMRSNGQCGYNNITRNFMCICSDRAHWKSCSEGSSKTALIIGLSTAAGGLSFIIICSICLILFRRWKVQRRRSKLFKRSASFAASNTECELGSSFSSPIFTYDELYEATNGFDASKELGDGGFGAVYKGKLKDGRVVAVKRLYENNFRRLEQFINEVKILSLLRHQNLVTLYGCTSRRSRELLLVYEFVPNGTVADHLHGPLASASLLPWPARMSIAIETADALNYLHSIEPQIIHRDVKTTNILLDGSYHVKVADFGLSRLLPLDATHVSTSPQGTPGYVDPEYHQSYQLTDKSDVYSFGVVLMELISSKPAVDITRQRSEVNLANLALKMIQRQELREFVDKGLGFESDYRVNAMITEFAGLGLRCLQSDRELRPGIKEVVDILRKIERIGFRDHEGHQRGEEDDAGKLQESTLLKKTDSPYSPKSVTERWLSMASTLSS
ncbi:putative serine/threonine-protein kinase [Platanthera zijinensis]|uniref:Serine/threonine-protein kinase n=1 Tax=Platanthera zijinensis TaxID=2320716 RepID=A0AAP0FUR0_9ASPA